MKERKAKDTQTLAQEDGIFVLISLACVVIGTMF